jgi:hypothetical protein
MAASRAAIGVLAGAAVVVGLVLLRRHGDVVGSNDAPVAPARADAPETPVTTRSTAPPSLPPAPTTPPDPAAPSAPPAVGTDQAQAKLADEALEPVRDAFLADLTAQAKAHDLVVRLAVDHRGNVVLVDGGMGCGDALLHTVRELVDRSRAKAAAFTRLGCASGLVLDL